MAGGRAGKQRRRQERQGRRRAGGRVAHLLRIGPEPGRSRQATGLLEVVDQRLVHGRGQTQRLHRLQHLTGDRGMVGMPVEDDMRVDIARLHGRDQHR